MKMTLATLQTIVTPTLRGLLWQTGMAEDAVQDFLTWAVEFDFLSEANHQNNPAGYAKRRATWFASNLRRRYKNDPIAQGAELGDLPPWREPVAHTGANPEKLAIIRQLAPTILPALRARRKGFNLISDLWTIHRDEHDFARRIGLVYSWVRNDGRQEWVWLELQRKNWTKQRCDRQAARARESFSSVLAAIRENRLLSAA